LTWQRAKRAAAAPVKSPGPNHHISADALVECPCDACALAIQCRAARMACEAFTLFLNGSPRRVWTAAPRSPTHRTYLRSLMPQAAQPKRSPLAAYG